MAELGSVTALERAPSSSSTTTAPAIHAHDVARTATGMTRSRLLAGALVLAVFVVLVVVLIAYGGDGGGTSPGY